MKMASLTCLVVSRLFTRALEAASLVVLSPSRLAWACSHDSCRGNGSCNPPEAYSPKRHASLQLTSSSHSVGKVSRKAGHKVGKERESTTW